MSRSLLMATAAAALLFAGQAGAATYVFIGALSGEQEAPIPAVTPGTGFTKVTIDDLFDTMRVEANFSGLLGPTAAAHIHCCAPIGTNAGVATTTPTFTGFPGGVTSGSYDHTFDMTLASSYNPGFITANGGTASGAFAALFAGLQAGDASFNVHTTRFPAGEIRGQLSY